MARKNRYKSDKERDYRDFYPTPIGLCREAMKKMRPFQQLYRRSLNINRPTRVLDIGAGMGVWGKALREVYPDGNFWLMGVDRFFKQSDPAYDGWIVGDFLDYNPEQKAEFTMGNWPFSMAEGFLLHAREVTTENAVIHSLLRTEFWGSIGRTKRLWSICSPHQRIRLARRPSFTGDGRSDIAQEYDMYFWHNRDNGRERAGGFPFMWEFDPEEDFWGKTLEGKMLMQRKIDSLMVDSLLLPTLHKGGEVQMTFLEP